jgi:predicted  nucleic acid-binding Zn-ribbon protein
VAGGDATEAIARLRKELAESHAAAAKLRSDLGDANSALTSRSALLESERTAHADDSEAWGKERDALKAKLAAAEETTARLRAEEANRSRVSVAPSATGSGDRDDEREWKNTEILFNFFLNF